ncbi:lipopolysaccharide biosynthesis protein [Alkalibacterium kapii]|uniref:Polyhydroxyalkanoate synthase n=1 Tax=Alkalibacterium kapii TaxID=426704 RepID=A0A511ATI9_9LACT|nr:oligosaccharide flippase family protein [Alkalibacterium kapii]GEK91032.1 polyhydroxyalkanoate synthase [Alkalibacterium kapii]
MVNITRFINYKSKKIKKNKFTKNIIMLTSGSLIAQIINTFSTPLITRLYSPEEYGVLTIYGSILAMMSISSLNYEQAIPIADDEDAANNVLFLSFSILFTFVISTTFIIAMFGSSIFEYYDDSGILYTYRYFLPIGMLFTGMYRIFIKYAYRKKNFDIIYRTKVTQSITGNLVKIFGGFFGLGSIMLIIGKIVANSAGVINLSKQLSSESYSNLSISKLYWSFKRYIKFPLYLTPSTFFQKFTNQIPIIFIGILYGSEMLGYYGLAYNIVKLPMNLIGQSVSNVFYAEAATLGKSDPIKLKRLSDKLIIRLVFIGMIPLIVILLFGPHLFSLFFGIEWYHSGVYARVISFLVFSNFIFTPVSRVYEVYEKQREIFLLSLFRLFISGLGFGVSYILNLNFIWALILYVIALSFVYLITYLKAQRILTDQIRLFNIYKGQK